MSKSLVLALMALVAAGRPADAQREVTARQVHDARATGPYPRFGDTVRLGGRVVIGTGVLHGTRLHVFIQDATGAVPVQQWRTQFGQVLHAGDSIVVLGVVHEDRDYNRIGNAGVTLVPGPRRPPPPLGIDSLTRGALDAAGSRLVALTGTVTRALLGRGDRALVLAAESDTTATVVVIEHNEGVAWLELDRFSPGDRIRVTGVLTRRTREDNSVRYTLRPRSSADLQATSMTVRTRNRLALTGIAVLVVAIAGYSVARSRRLTRENRRRHDEAQREYAERYRLLIERAPVGILVHRDGRIIFANDEFARIVGAQSAEALRDGDALALVHPDERADVRRRTSNILSGRPQPLTVCRRLLRPDGTTIETEASASHILFGGAAAVQVVVHDVDERRRAELALRESEARFRLVASATKDVVWDWDLVTDRVAWGEATLRVLGFTPQELGDGVNGWISHVHEDDRERVRDSLYGAIGGGAESWEAEYRFGRKCGGWATVLDRGYILRGQDGHAIRLVGAMQDLTDRIHLEERLRQAQKMEAVGQLAAGIAHDFNNILTVMSTYSDLVLAELPADSPSRAALEAIPRAGARAGGLTRQLLSFSRRDMVRPEVFDLNLAVRDVGKLLQRTIGEHITLEVLPGRAPCHVLADRGQIGQVIMNLVINARDAMASGGGTLTVETGVYEAAQLPRSAAQRVTGGRHVLLAVRDTGVGMDEEALSRIFEPFFTTKPPGHGTGLGLATVYGIVTQARGAVWAESVAGQGSSFLVLLPEAAASARASGGEPPVVTGPPRTVSATVLLVEDEAAVRLSVTRSLIRHGFAVMQAKNANDALMLWREMGGDIDAVITDVVMPGMRGPELVEQLRAARPRLPVLYMSGYTDFLLGAAELAAGNTAFVAKPFSIDDLAAEVRSLLESAELEPAA